MCMFSFGRPRIGQPSSGFHVVVRDPIVPDENGTVSCIPGCVIQPPLHVEWKIDGHIVNPEEIGVDASGLCARHVPPTRACTVAVRSSTGLVGEATVRVQAAELPVVTGYECTNASSAHARDGRVVAQVMRAPDKCLFLWTSGIVTQTPVLTRAPPGTYAVTLMTVHRDAVPSVHACPPGTVRIEPR